MRVIIAAVALVSVLALTAAVNLVSFQAQADNLDEAAVVRIVEQLLQERPELVVRALQTYREREEAREAAQQKRQLSARQEELYANADDPIIGNPNGSIILVEFFDYRCGYCKRSLNTVLALAQKHKDLKIVFKEFPILGEDSVAAARVSLAVQQLDPAKYGEFHTKLMRHRGRMDKATLIGMTADMGLDAGAVEQAMNSNEVTATIRANHELAESLGINGTPAFAIGEQVVPGAVSQEVLEKLIEEQRD